MGYRSEVRCLIYGTKENLDAYITLKSLIEGNLIFQPDSGFREALSRYTTTADVYDPESKTVKPITLHVLDLHASSWKWYESYDDVQAWELFMQEAETEGSLQYEFIRIGEDYNDIEVQGSSDAVSLISTHSSITDNMEKSDPLPLGF